MGELLFGLDRVVIFYDYLRIDGWVVPDAGEPVAVNVRFGSDVVAETANVDLPAPDIALPGAQRFSLSALIPTGLDRARPVLTFRFDDGHEHEVELETYSDQRRGESELAFLRFTEMVAERPGAEVLEVGSRARSGVVRKQWFKGAVYTGTDILEGPNVDMVADAHDLSALGDSRFDFAFSISTFEHLAMPWKAVLELNRVLKTGGVVYVQTHQTCGMHELPWDFWRFSESAFRALFNRHTGFEVIEAGLNEPLHIVPFYGASKMWEGFEAAAGFYQSYVIARKVSSTELRWDVPLGDLVEVDYPA
ncbi:MAG TPA: methyltransferase domain-containing protein [Actinomycetota bacterium]|nr:methyltransferase domain-containing protein [Actinomycetota bacterium]